MSFILVDYTGFYFTSVAKTAVPEAVSGKFVQIRQGSTTYLVFSPRELTKYHANIVERFCMDRGIEGGYDADGTKYVISDTAWKATGGGKFEWDRTRKTLKLYDNSLAYGKFNATVLRETLSAMPEFAGFTILIG